MVIGNGGLNINLGSTSGGAPSTTNNNNTSGMQLYNTNQYSSEPTA